MTQPQPLTPDERIELERLLRAPADAITAAGVSILQRALIEGRSWRTARPLEAIPLRDPELAMRASVPLILGAVCKAWGITLEQLRSPSRVRRLSRARQVGVWLARRLTHQPLTELAHQVGRRDHTTMIHGLHALDDRLQRDPDLRAQVQVLLEELTAPKGRDGRSR